MNSIRWQLVDEVVRPDEAFNQPAAAVQARQLEAAQEVFEQRVDEIALLRRRADEAGIRRITQFSDLVPLLFAHTVYKSYPASFVEKGQWDRMLRWLGTLSVEPTDNVDVSGVRDIDEWIARLHAAGHRVLATSGTSGKCSILNQTAADFERKVRHFRHVSGWPCARPANDRDYFFLGPIRGPNSAVEAAQIGILNWAKPGGVHALTDEPMKISEISRLAALRRRMAQGEASPEEIAAFEAESAVKARDNHERLLKLAQDLIGLRKERLFVLGLWAQYMTIIELARKQGIGDGEFNSECIVKAGGGIKGVALPPDYKDRVSRFFGKVHRPGNYGMTEMASMTSRCEAGRYHATPGLIMLVLDAAGERLLAPSAGAGGEVEGRFAFLDLLYEGRWGGVITGDKVTMDTSDRCACGRHGPTLLDNIARFAQVGEDDPIGCAGTIDAYIRGAVGAA